VAVFYQCYSTVQYSTVQVFYQCSFFLYFKIFENIHSCNIFTLHTCIHILYKTVNYFLSHNNFGHYKIGKNHLVKWCKCELLKRIKLLIFVKRNPNIFIFQSKILIWWLLIIYKLFLKWRRKIKLNCWQWYIFTYIPSSCSGQE
jgi:hypothetical protein